MRQTGPYGHRQETRPRPARRGGLRFGPRPPQGRWADGVNVRDWREGNVFWRVSGGERLLFPGAVLPAGPGWRKLMDGEDSGPVSLVADPGLAAQTQRHLERAVRSPADEAAAAAGCGAMVVSTAGLITSVVIHFVTGLSWWWVGGSAVAAAAIFIAAAVATPVIEVSSGTLDPRDRDRDRDRFVEPSDLDDSCRELLRRAQRAIGAVLGSGVYASDFLDHAAGETVLRRHEWDIAAALREITRLRAELASAAAADAAGPMAAAVLDSQQHALALARDAIAARVSALERYAAQVETADAAQQDGLSALRLSGLNDRYLDLVARTAVDERANAEITGLTEQAATAAQVFRGSLHQATTTAQALAFPATPNTRPCVPDQGRAE